MIDIYEFIQIKSFTLNTTVSINSKLDLHDLN